MKQEESVKNYNAQYYAKKKEDILAKRKQKYWSDPNHRAKVRAKSRRRYRQLLRSPNKRIGYTTKRKNSKDLFSISYVCDVVGKQPSTIRALERDGHIPMTLFTDSRGWRLYTDRQIDLLSYAFSNYDDKKWTKEEMQKYLTYHWDKKEN